MDDGRNITTGTQFTNDYLSNLDVNQSPHSLIDWNLFMINIQSLYWIYIHSTNLYLILIIDL